MPLVNKIPRSYVVASDMKTGENPAMFKAVNAGQEGTNSRAKGGLITALRSMRCVSCSEFRDGSTVRGMVHSFLYSHIVRD